MLDPRRILTFMNSGCGMDYALKKNKTDHLEMKRHHVMTATHRLPDIPNRLVPFFCDFMCMSNLLNLLGYSSLFKTVVKRFEE